jgi:hypothetical protein
MQDEEERVMPRSDLDAARSAQASRVAARPGDLGQALSGDQQH